MKILNREYLAIRTRNIVYFFAGLSALVISAVKIHFLGATGEGNILIIMCTPLLVSTLMARVFYAHLRDNAKRYRRIFQLSPYPMWIYDRASLRFQDVNAAAIAHYGYSRKEFLAKTILDIRPIAFREAAEKQIRSAGHGEERRGLIVTHEKKNGTPIQVEVTANDIDLRTFRTRLVVAIDVTERLQIEAEKERLKKEAETANRTKSKFLANISHEIRTPLGAIIGFAELLKDESLEGDQRQHCLNTISRNGGALLQLVNEILDLAKIEANKIEIESMPTNFGLIAADVVALFQNSAKKKNIQIEVDNEVDKNKFYFTDPTRVKQVLINLMGNALKFTEKGSIRMEISERALNDGTERSEIRISVVDTGVGLSESAAAKLFRDFSQGDEMVTRKFGGTGLGLSLSKKLAEVLGGSLWLEGSTKGHGSSFCFSLTLMRASGAPSTNADHEESVENLLKGLRILLVDDALDNRTLVARFLRSAGAHVSCAADGAKGVTLALGGHYDLVLMDVRMPKLDGFAALAELRKRSYTAPVVALTAYAMKEDRERCLRMGFAEHIKKPVKRQALVKTVKRIAEAAGCRESF